MKKILITGANSYIGCSFETYVNKNGYHYIIDTIDMKEDAWKHTSFSSYDTIFHVAGIAHSDNGKISEEKAALYYKINSDLVEEVAKKAKKDGVSQFIHMSSMIVYGESGAINTCKMITKETIPSPINSYGDSKWQGERKLYPLMSSDFSVVILRPPMIYGKGSKGNYPTLSMLAKKLPIFPNIDNSRSMLYIENLCEFVHLMIQNEECGIFMPQNGEYSRTTDMVKLIAQVHNKKIRTTKCFNVFLRLLSPIVPIINKAFGNLTYEKSLSKYKENYQVVRLSESIRRTEKS